MDRWFEVKGAMNGAAPGFDQHILVAAETSPKNPGMS